MKYLSFLLPLLLIKNYQVKQLLVSAVFSYQTERSIIHLTDSSFSLCISQCNAIATLYSGMIITEGPDCLINQTVWIMLSNIHQSTQKKLLSRRRSDTIWGTIIPPQGEPRCFLNAFATLSLTVTFLGSVPHIFVSRLYAWGILISGPIKVTVGFPRGWGNHN